MSLGKKAIEDIILHMLPIQSLQIFTLNEPLVNIHKKNCVLWQKCKKEFNFYILVCKLLQKFIGQKKSQIFISNVPLLKTYKNFIAHVPLHKIPHNFLPPLEAWQKSTQILSLTCLLVNTLKIFMSNKFYVKIHKTSSYGSQ